MRFRTVITALVLATLLLGVLVPSVDAQSPNSNPNACKNKNKRKCEVPEVPWTLVLPVATVGIAAGYYLVQRRREDDAVLGR